MRQILGSRRSNLFVGVFALVAVLLLAYSGIARASSENILVFGDYSSKNQLATDLTALGHTVTNVTTLPTVLTSCDTIWHVGAFAALSSAERTRLSDFLAAQIVAIPTSCPWALFS
jgi:hypothetical protein